MMFRLGDDVRVAVARSTSTTGALDFRLVEKSEGRRRKAAVSDGPPPKRPQTARHHAAAEEDETQARAAVTSDPFSPERGAWAHGKCGGR